MQTSWPGCVYFQTHLLWLHLGLRTTDIDINPLRFKLANHQVKVRIPNKCSMRLWKADLWLSWDSYRKLWIQCIPGKLEGWTHRGRFPWKAKEPRRKQFILQEESFRMHKSGLKRWVRAGGNEYFNYTRCLTLRLPFDAGPKSEGEERAIKEWRH